MSWISKMSVADPSCERQKPVVINGTRDEK